MQHRVPFGWILLLGLIGQFEKLNADVIDPRFPSELDQQASMPKPNLSWWPGRRVKQLADERDRLMRVISKLPQHEPKPQTDHMGYHSPIHTPDSLIPAESQTLMFKFSWSPPLASIALAPAFHPGESEFVTYGFPKRFKIEIQQRHSLDFETVVDWMDQDFPDPGPYPVYFDDINQTIYAMRLTIPPQSQDSGAAFFALGEVFLFQRNPGGETGSNMALWIDRIFESSDSLTILPRWAPEYLHDGYGGLGPPLSDETFEGEDLFITSQPDSELEATVSLTMDLGEPRKIGRVDLWPAKSPFGVAVSPFGFPGKVKVERSDDPAFNEVTEELPDATDGELIPGSILTFFGRNEESRYIRVTMSDLEEHNGDRVLGLGEISITAFNHPHPVAAEIVTEGIPQTASHQLPRLIDGFSQRRRILSQSERIRGLAQRRPLDRRLDWTLDRLNKAELQWTEMKRRLIVVSGGSFIFMLLSVFFLQRRHRRKSMDALRDQITRDLHDEVGSSMGSISLSAERMGKIVYDSETKKELSDLSLMAREASASLLEVVWVTDQSEVYLPALIARLVLRAEKVLQGVEVLIEVAEDLPEYPVSLASKRHLTMFFKEAIHNCARHSGADQVEIHIGIREGSLEIEIKDNGCGFDHDEPGTGWGLSNMVKRAEELEGKAFIESEVGSGASIRLSVPVEVLEKDPKSAYWTSN